MPAGDPYRIQPEPVGRRRGDIETAAADEILVKALGTDKKGRLNFSRKQALSSPMEKEENE